MGLASTVTLKASHGWDGIQGMHCGPASAAALFTYDAARDALREIIDKVWGHCERSGIRGRTVTLKVKFANFHQITRSRTAQMHIRTRSELEQLGNALFEPLFPVAKGIRLLGVTVSNFDGTPLPASGDLPLFAGRSTGLADGTTHAQ